VLVSCHLVDGVPLQCQIRPVAVFRWFALEHSAFWRRYSRPFPAAFLNRLRSRFLVDPDRYVLYSCTEIAKKAQTNVIRVRELEALMAKAGEGTGGQLASTMAYRPEYAQLRGEMDQLRKAAADKNCKFTPGGRISDQAVR
jgi:hypothetical protein